ncbi:hypothetical protein ACH0BF_16585 [Pseudobacillus sp. 179-B 2D1 NHS]|uniref:hypothetical protein n=1 Tax=Pseudobacillus sp. 179-B 2D1 NHS TaxID=3374292 RepID=UPI003879198C
MIPIKKSPLLTQASITRALNEFLDSHKDFLISECEFEYRIKDKKPMAFLNFVNEHVPSMKQSKETLNQSIYDGYMDWIVPLEEFICKKGDIIEFKSKFDSSGELTGALDVSLNVSIPEEHSKDWIAFLDNEYQKLHFLYENVQFVAFNVESKRLKQICFHMKTNPYERSLRELLSLEIEELKEKKQEAYQLYTNHLINIWKEAQAYIEQRKELHTYRFYATRRNEGAYFRLSETSTCRVKLT